jgi:hypothetical protein
MPTQTITSHDVLLRHALFISTLPNRDHDAPILRDTRISFFYLSYLKYIYLFITEEADYRLSFSDVPGPRSHIPPAYDVELTFDTAFIYR